MTHYGDRDYWERRYATRRACFEWYLPWASIEADVKDVLQQMDSSAQQKRKFVILGTGTSTVGENLFDLAAVIFPAGADVFAIDWSKTVIDHMQERAHTQTDKRAGLQYVKASCESLKDVVANASVDLLFDKATLDSILCGETPEKALETFNVAVSAAFHALKPGGVWIHISYSKSAEGAKAALFEASWAEVAMVELEPASDFEPPHYMFILRKNAQ